MLLNNGDYFFKEHFSWWKRNIKMELILIDHYYIYLYMLKNIILLKIKNKNKGINF